MLCGDCIIQSERTDRAEFNVPPFSQAETFVELSPAAAGQATPACLEEMPLAHSDAELKIFGYRYFIYMASGAKQIRRLLIIILTLYLLSDSFSNKMYKDEKRNPLHP